MVYAEDLKSLTRKGLWVRLPPPAQKLLRPTLSVGRLLFSAEVGRRKRAPGPREYAGMCEHG